MGADGFDVIDNGSGIPESEFASLAKTLPNREKNELYKTRSLGYMGEALHSLCRSSHLTIFTKHASCAHGYKLIFDSEAELHSKIKYHKLTPGTTVEVRKIHEISAKTQYAYKRNIKEHYEAAML